jgi:hypothetical protein
MNPRANRICAPLLVAALCSATAAAQNYLNDLGPVAPGLAINNADQVSLLNHYYSGGTLTALPSGFAAGGTSQSGTPVVTGGGISSNGFIAGINTTDPNAGVAYFTISSGAVTQVPTTYGNLDPSITQTGTGINASGTVIGYYYFPNGEQGNAFEVSGGTPSLLAFPGQSAQGCSSGIAAGGGGEALAINDAGVITGFLPSQLNTPCTMHAFVDDNGTYDDLGPGEGYAINASGAVTGTNWTISEQNGQILTSPLQAFLYSNGTLTELPDGATVGYGINAGGYIVGDGATHAFFYNGVVIDLNTFILPGDPLRPYVTLTDARGINDSGLVVVNGVDSRTQAQHAYLLQVPLIQVAPGPLSFASEPIGSTSAPQSVTFANTGATALTLGTATISGAYVIESNNCGAALAAAASCTISVAYAPTASASPVGTLILPAASVPIAVPLSTALSVALTSSSSTTTAGTAVTLTWAATAGASCTASGGASGDGWSGSLTASGSKAVSEKSAGSYTYGITCTAGSQSQSAQTSVTVSWPPVTVTLTASPTSVTTGGTITLSWSSANATSCASSGGGSNDGWPMTNRPTSGSVMITEPNPVITGASETLTFSMTCTSSLSNLSGGASAKVTQLDASSSNGGGGGLDLMSLLSLLGMLAGCQRLRERAS